MPINMLLRLNHPVSVPTAVVVVETDSSVPNAGDGDSGGITAGAAPSGDGAASSGAAAATGAARTLARLGAAGARCVTARVTVRLPAGVRTCCCATARRTVGARFGLFLSNSSCHVCDRRLIAVPYNIRRESFFASYI